MPLEFAAAKNALENILARREHGSSIQTPNGKSHMVVGAGLHSETLECLLVIFDPESGAYTAVVPGAARDTDEPVEVLPDFDTKLKKSVWRHYKGGVYTEIARVRSRDGLLVVYVSHADGIWWLRPADMFDDGRFEASKETPLTASEIGI